MKVDRLLKRLIPYDHPTLRPKIAGQISMKKTKQHDDTSYMLADLDDLIEKYDTWKRLLPGIQPFYAIKCNDNSVVIDCLARLGCNFDCASKIEIQKVLSHGVHPGRIVYANPTKQVSYITYAARMGVMLMTADNEAEIRKIAKHCPCARILIRVAPQTNGSVQIDLSEKFGCNREVCLELMLLARTLSLKVKGISFHVGSGIRDDWSMSHTIQYVSELFHEARKLGFPLSLLDIGGGFPGHSADRKLFVRMANSISRSLDEFFPPSSNVRVIAEPGRYFVTSAFTLYTAVIGVNCVTTNNHGLEDEAKYVYYLSEGFFGCFNGIVTEDSPITPHTSKKAEVMLCDLRGPTRHSADVVLLNCKLPSLELFDWLSFGDCGAYSTAITMSRSQPVIYWTISDDACFRLIGGRRIIVWSDDISKKGKVYTIQ